MNNGNEDENSQYTYNNSLAQFYGMTLIDKEGFIPGIGNQKIRELVLYKSKDGENWEKSLPILKIETGITPGNLFLTNKGNLILFYYSKDSSSSNNIKTNYKISEDNGLTWTQPKEFVLSKTNYQRLLAENKKGDLYFLADDNRIICKSEDNGKTWITQPLAERPFIVDKFIDKNGIIHIITYSMHQPKTLTGYLKSVNPL